MTSANTKEVTLPSRGMFYDGAVPGGVISIRKWTVPELAMLANQSIKMAEKLRKIIDSCTILPPNFKASSLLITDRFALMLYQREFSLGTSLYKFDYRCKYCSNVIRGHVCDVAQEFDETLSPEGSVEPIVATLPDAGVSVGLRLLRGIDESEIAAVSSRMTLQSNDHADPSMIVRMCHSLVSVDGAELKFIEKERFVRSLTVRDSLAMSNAIDAVEPGIKTELHPSCRMCGAENEIDMMEVLSGEFFRPTVV